MGFSRKRDQQRAGGLLAQRRARILAHRGAYNNAIGMKDERKTKARLIDELNSLRRRVEELDAAEARRQQAEKALQETDRRFRALLQSASAAVVIIDSQGRIAMVNTRAESLFGYSRDEMVGQPLEMLLPERYRTAHTAHRAAFMRSPRIRPMGTDLRLFGRSKDGVEFPIEVGLSHVEADGDTMGMAFILDVTGRKQAEEGLRLMQRAIEAATNGIVISDAQQPDTPILYVNPAFERITGYRRDEVIGRNCRFLQGADRDQPALGDLRAALRAERACQVVLRNYRKDGGLFWNELDIAPVHDDDGRLTHFVGVQNDITERKLAEEELAHKNRELDQALVAASAATRAKSEFLANMSHEIRTPLNAIIGMTGLLLDTPLSKEQLEYAETVRISGDVLLSVINDILDFSKIEAGKMEMEQQPFDLLDCVKSSLDLIAPLAAEKTIEMIYTIDERVPATLIGDVTRLRQVLVNLLSNAVKFTAAGEIVVTVAARPLADRAHEMHFTVRDTGIGIPRERIGRLFQPFSQVDASTTRRYGGTGLGLVICKRLVEMMGGAIWVDSEVGKGSAFHFTIRAQAAQAPARAAASADVAGRRALIVDDNTTNRTILIRQAQSWGLQARDAASGPQALEWIRQGEEFDVAVLDIQMPDMDGVTLAEEIRRLRPALPLVMLSSIGMREPDAQGLNIAAFLTKPIKPAQLYSVLASIFRGQPVAAQDAPSGIRIDAHMAERHPLHILLAEDNIVNQKVTLRILERLGYRADVVANGLEVLEALERQRYDVVLMDVQMPEMDGLEAARQINRRWPQGGRPRLIAMTAYALEGDREWCLAAGMEDYITKPVKIEELIESLERAASPAPREAASVAPRPEGPAGGEPTIEVSALNSLVAVMGSEVADVLDVFFENAAKLMGEIRGAAESGDAALLKSAAHSLKSSSAMFGALALSALCKDLENLGRAGTAAGAGARLAGLQAEYDRAMAALRTERQRIARIQR
jgi:PAS domain S-box-containing protein